MSDFVVVDGMLTAYHGAGGDVVLPDDVQGIRQGVFANRTDITSITIPSALTYVEHKIFEECRSLRKITAPRTSIRFLRQEGRMFSVLRGYFESAHSYQDSIVAEYEAYLAEREKLLPMIFREDAAVGLAAFAHGGKITAENFQSKFFEPAQKGNAVRCVAFLLDWQQKHLSRNPVTEFELQEEIVYEY